MKSIMVHVKIFKTINYPLKQVLNLSNKEGTYFAIHAIKDIFFAYTCTIMINSIIYVTH